VITESGVCFTYFKMFFLTLILLNAHVQSELQVQFPLPPTNGMGSA
jgi:hypothetical protein